MKLKNIVNYFKLLFKKDKVIESDNNFDTTSLKTCRYLYLEKCRLDCEDCCHVNQKGKFDLMGAYKFCNWYITEYIDPNDMDQKQLEYFNSLSDQQKEFYKKLVKGDQNDSTFDY